MKTLILRSSLVTMFVAAVGCSSGSTTPAGEHVGSEVSALTQWTTTVIDDNIPAADEIVECDVQGTPTLFALNSDKTLWSSPVNHQFTDWHFVRTLPPEAFDLACLRSTLHVLMAPGPLMAVTDLTVNGSDGLELFADVPNDISAVAGTYGLKPDGSHLIDRLFGVNTSGTLYTYTGTWEEGIAFPPVSHIAVSVNLRNAAGDVIKPIAMFAFDRQSDAFWYTDNASVPGSWEASSLRIPDDGSNPRKDIAISLYGIARGRRMAGLYVLRNGKLYYNEAFG
jgi:hypothetical protein